MENTTDTNTDLFDPSEALDFTDDPFVDEDAVWDDDDLWMEDEEDRGDDIASAWGF